MVGLHVIESGSVGMGIPMGIPVGIPVGMWWVWGLKCHPHGRPDILLSQSLDWCKTYSLVRETTRELPIETAEPAQYYSVTWIIDTPSSNVSRVLFTPNPESSQNVWYSEKKQRRWSDVKMI